MVDIGKEDEKIMQYNKLIAQFMGWAIVPNPTDPKYPDQEWYYSKNTITGGWSSGQGLSKTEENVGQKRLDLIEGMWKSLLNPVYGRAGKYRHDWNELMPVVEKIESLESTSGGHYAVYIGSNGCTIQDTKFRSDKPPYWYFNDETHDTKITATWEAVVKFLMWYNENRGT